MAKSTSMIAFLVTMPISIRKPITTGRLIAFWVITRPRMAPPIESGSDNRIVKGCRKLAKSRMSTPSTIMTPAPIALPKPVKTSAMTSASPVCWIDDARRQVLRRRQLHDGLDHLAERIRAAHVALERDAQRAVVAVDRGRALAELDVGDRGERHRRAVLRRHLQDVDEAPVAAHALRQLNADRDLAVAGIELGEVRADIADRADAHGLGDHVGRDAEFGGERGLRPDADLGPVERRRRERRLERRDRRHLALQLRGRVDDDVLVGPGHDELQPALAVRR